MTAVIGTPFYQQEAPREPPHDYDLEQAVIGATLMRPALLDVLADQLAPGHFADPTHGEIWRLMLEDFSRNRAPSPVAINTRMIGDKYYEELGGAKYLARLAGAATMALPSALENYARGIVDLWMRRQTINELLQTIEHLYDTRDGGAASDHIERLETEIATLTGDVTTGDTTVAFSTAVDRTMDQLQEIWKADGKLVGVTTGLADLNAKLGGLHTTDLIILAGRPSMGKSALAQTTGEAAAREGIVTAFYSLEMSAEQIVGRAISASSGIEGYRIREGRLTEQEKMQVSQTSLDIKSLPLFIEDAPGLTVPQLRTKARRLKRRHGLGLIIVDYLQLMRGTSSSRENNRVLEISEISRGLKAIAKELKVPVLALSQLSRQVEQREDRRPQLSDLRESGSIEQDADVVMFVFRDEYYLERSEPDPSQTKKWEDWSTRRESCRNVAEIIIGKQRHGPTGTVKLYFDGNLTKFGDLEKNHGQN